MANSNITNLGSIAVPLAGTEVVPIWGTTPTKKVTVENLTAGRTVSVGRLLVGTLTAVGTNAGEAYFGNSSAIRWRNAANTGWLNVIYVDASNNLQLGGGGATADLVMAVGGIGEVARVTTTGIKPISGKGMDFSAVTAAAGMTSKVLTNYEEGTWTPAVTSQTGALTAYTSSGRYTRVGNQVTLIGTFKVTTPGTAGGVALITGFPFTSSSAMPSYVGVARESSLTGIIYQALAYSSSTSGQVASTINGPIDWTLNASYILTIVYFI